MKKMFQEFKAFISKGNVLDMAIGVIVATAFGKITTALVNNVLMPFIGWIFGGTNATDALNITLKPAVLDEAGNVVTEASVFGFGTFLNAVIDFLIVAFICFVIVKAFNKATELAERKKRAAEAEAAAKAAAEAAAAPKEPTEAELLKAILEQLQKQK